MSKLCKVCGRSSAQVDFQRRRSSKDGLQDVCAYCSTAANAVRKVWGGGPAWQFLQDHLPELNAHRAAGVIPTAAGKQLATLYPRPGTVQP